MNTKICVVITAKNFQALKKMIKRAEEVSTDLIEIRFDYLMNKLDTSVVRKLTKLPLIATNRLAGEGGVTKIAETERLNTLICAANSGFDYVDVELATRDVEKVIKNIKASGSKAIVSFHDFNSTPSLINLSKILKNEIKVGAEVCKIVTTAKRRLDNLTCLEFVTHASKKVPIVCFCMGTMGIPSRLLTPLFGAAFTYASIQRGRESASGQLNAIAMRKIFGLMGYSIGN
ncbi:MAG: type I 3-dehydroquinate dehydratase [Candidatus Bathyarchaeota archaeon]